MGVLENAAIAARIMEMQRQLEDIRQNLQNIPMRFAGKPLAIALEQCLRECGGTCDWYELLERLKAGGVDRPAYLDKNLRIVVTKDRQRNFLMQGDYVILLPREKLLPKVA